ncbi:D-alanyl-D-alanine carboxypeptidase family protein [Paenibacillus mendelii]|uniref:D-alanyl-D-alanine carboxypeptidase family protein n=1 Tax=Paenibacillus mendelii TaxID=206163 RepID=A0ABV6JH06_9BACL|nr:D-alanyl-D-alanine carboxypeptidase family protein [Paenibacillus mendelii]MCQ6558080.1 D-alanyl-D-alanine carboxypeptidase [Paenibacillus mendelii]
MRLDRKWMRLLGALIIGWSVSAVPSEAAAESRGAPAPIGTHAKAAALIDVESGRLLYSKDGDTPMRIASLTKIMTAIVAIEHGKLSDKVKTSKRAFAKEGSSIYLKLGEEMSLQNMLYGLMLRSGNDAATAIAEHVGGSEEGFVHLMNEKARMLGLTNSQFMNPHGLDQEGHYSSANDLAKLTAYAMHNPTFKAIVKTPVKTAPNPNDEWDYKWTNKNKMLHMYDGADGVKTGYTKLSLRCLVSSATRNGQQLAAVTINDSNDWVDHSKLLDWGFANYPLTEIAYKGQPVDGYALAVGRTVRFPFAAGEMEELKTKLVLLDPNSTYYALGERGTLEWYIGDNKIGSTMVYEPAGARMSLPDRQTAIWTASAQSEPVKPWARSFGGALKQVLSVLFGGMGAG